MWLRIAGIVFPIVLVVLTGFAYARWRRPDLSDANRLNMDIFLPALIFAGMSGREFSLQQQSGLALGCALVVLGSGLLAWPVARLLRFQTGTFVPSMMFGNVGNMGFPLMALTFGAQAMDEAVLFMVVVTLLQFAISSWLLTGRWHWSELWRQPLLLIAASALALNLGGITLWPPLLTGIRMMGDLSVGFMIFALGIRLGTARLGSWNIALVGAVVSPVAGMACAWAAGQALGLNRTEQDMLFLMGALPPAVSNFIFADRYQQEPEKVASMVLVANAAAIVFVPLALALRL